MTAESILAVMIYALVTSLSPGPNNTMLLASGANFGLRRTVPLMLGIALGFAAMLLAVGLGLGVLFKGVPALHLVLRYVGAAWMLYLAWRIATAGGPGGAGGKGRPMSFVAAAAFQWVNPKAWIVAIGAVATYTPEQGFFLNLLTVALVYTLCAAPGLVLWAAAGTALRGVLGDPMRLRIFNVAMALLLVASLYPILFPANGT